MHPPRHLSDRHLSDRHLSDRHLSDHTFLTDTFPVNTIDRHLSDTFPTPFRSVQSRTYLSNDASAQVTHQAFQSSFDQSAKQLPEQGGIGQHHDLSALSIPNLPIAQAATAQHRLKE